MKNRAFTGTSILLNEALHTRDDDWPDFPFSDTLYEVIRLDAGQPVFLKDHTDRLLQALQRKGIQRPLPDYSTLKAALNNLIKANGPANTNVEIRIYLHQQQISAQLMGYIPSYYPPASLYQEGVQTCLLQQERPDPNTKAKGLKAREEADLLRKNQTEIYEVLLVDHQQQLTEGSRSNLFFIQGNKLITAPDFCVLKGITRKHVLELVAEKKKFCDMRQLSLRELADMDAAFLTGTSIGILPIKQIGDQVYDVNNKVMKQLRKAYEALRAAQTSSF